MSLDAAGQTWRKITMKFTGRCIECSKPILAGHEGMWSKGVGVKHLGCAGADGDEPESSAAAIPCMICGKHAGCEGCEFRDACDISNVSPNCLCRDCSQKDDVLQLYLKSAGGRFPSLLR